MTEQLQRASTPPNPAAISNDADQVFHTPPSSSFWRSGWGSQSLLFSTKTARQEAKYLFAVQATISAVYFHLHFDASIPYKDSSEDR